MDDLRTRLAEAADRAAHLARAPGPAEALRRVRARRRRRAGGVALTLAVVAAALVVIGRGSGPELPAADRLDQDRWRHLPWRGLEAREWKATVPRERPLDPVLVAARGERDGEPWRLVVYRSTYHPRGGRPAVADVCSILDWVRLDLGKPLWGAHGTCTPETQATSVLAAGLFGPDRDVAAVVGRAPATAARVRLELRGWPPVEAPTAAVAGGRVPGRFYVAFVARAARLQRVVALDGGGRQVGAAPGPGDLARVPVAGFPPTGPVTVVGRTAGGSGEVTAWPIRDGFCMAVDLGGGVASRCGRPNTELDNGPDPGGLDPVADCTRYTGADGKPARLRLVYGGVPRAARAVRVEAAGWRVEVPARDGGELFGRALFLAELPPATSLARVRVTAIDRSGRPLWVFVPTTGCG